MHWNLIEIEKLNAFSIIENFNFYDIFLLKLMFDKNDKEQKVKRIQSKITKNDRNIFLAFFFFYCV